MKELYSVPVQIHASEPITKTRIKPEAKRWAVTEGRKDKKWQRLENQATERHYHNIITSVIEVLPQYGGDTILSRDCKYDGGFTDVHGFITSTFYWRLDCLLNYNYEIFYDFHNCPYEAMVRKMMEAYPLYKVCNHHPSSGLFNKPYSEILALHDPKHLQTIKGTALNS
jgi:hypothetical protein